MLLFYAFKFCVPYGATEFGHRSNNPVKNENFFPAVCKSIRPNKCKTLHKFCFMLTRTHMYRLFVHRYLIFQAVEHYLKNGWRMIWTKKWEFIMFFLCFSWLFRTQTSKCPNNNMTKRKNNFFLVLMLNEHFLLFLLFYLKQYVS